MPEVFLYPRIPLSLPWSTYMKLGPTLHLIAIFRGRIGGKIGYWKIKPELEKDKGDLSHIIVLTVDLKTLEDLNMWG